MAASSRAPSQILFTLSRLRFDLRSRSFWLGLLGWLLFFGAAQGQKIGTVYHYEMECSGCTTQILVEFSAADLRNRINRSQLTLNVVFRDIIYEYDDIFYDKIGDIGYAMFNIRLTTKGQKNFVVKLVDVSRHGIRQDIDSQMFKMNIVPVRRTIDTAVDPCVACVCLDDSLARVAGFTDKFLPAMTTDGFYTRIKKLKMITRKGSLVKNGYDKYYLHVVSTKKLEIGIRLLSKQSADTINGLDPKQVENTPYGPIVYFPVMKAKEANTFYVAVISEQKRFKTAPRKLRSKALFVKAIEYDMDSAYMELRSYVGYTHYIYDSLNKRLRKEMEPDAYKKGPFMLLLTEAERKVKEADYYYESYKLFDNILNGKAKRAQKKAKKAAAKKKKEAAKAAEAAKKPPKPVKPKKTKKGVAPDSLSADSAGVDSSGKEFRKAQKLKAKEAKKAEKEKAKAKKMKLIKDTNLVKKKPRRFIRFFKTSNYYNDKTIKFSISSHPFGLPKLGKFKSRGAD